MSRSKSNLSLIDGWGRYVGVLAAIAIVVIGMVWAVGSHGGKHPHKPAAAPLSNFTNKPTSPVSAPTVPNPSSTQVFKATLDERVKAFTAAYFSVSPPKGVTDVNQALERSAQNSKKAVQPFATAHFMQTALFGYTFYGSPADAQMLKSQVTITAKPITGLVDAHITSHKAVGTVMVDYSKTDSGGTVDLGQKPQQLTLVKQSNTWFVNAAPLT